MTTLPRVLAIGISHAPSRSATSGRRPQNRNAPGPKGLRAKILAQVSEARELGFDLEFMQIKRNQVDLQLAQLRERLSREKPDLFIIGFGIRGTVEYTELFESLVNLSREVSPGTQMGFNTSMERTVDVCSRCLGLERGAKDVSHDIELVGRSVPRKRPRYFKDEARALA